MGKTAPNNTEGTPEGTPPADPAPETETAPETEPVVEPTPEGTPAPVSEPTTENRSNVTLLINGSACTNMQTIQQHINSLETFRSEAIEQSRRDYVSGLATQNKIPATQIESLTEHVLDLNDAQYAKWKASYDAAPAASLFGTYGKGPADSGRPANENGGESVADRIKTLENIVADHRRTGMTQEQIETKGSYKELQTLKSQQQTTN